jgi:hypothetical protein
MWGSTTETPNSAVSRFGARKLDNTPHLFFIGENDRVPVESYFSPSDQVSARIVRAAQGAAHSLYFATLTFTRDDIARTMIDRHGEGLFVRGIMDNDSDQGNEFASLQSGGVDVLLKKGLSGMLHHKYLLVDADAPNANAAHVITGSHNWSNAAEFSNNENTLVIHDRAISEQYLQEWYTRYREAGGAGVIILDVEDGTRVPQGYSVAVYPNPLPRGAAASLQGEGTSGLSAVRVLDILGRVRMVVRTDRAAPDSRLLRIDTRGLYPGTYFLQLQHGNGEVRTARMVVLPQ